MTEGLKDLSVLVVEDNDDILVLIENVLEIQGAKMFSFENAENALDFYKEKHGEIDLVFSDVFLPGMNGIQFISEMKKINPDVKCLLSSGYTDDFVESEAQMEKLGPFIQKPFTVRKFLDAIHSLL